MSNRSKSFDADSFSGVHSAARAFLMLEALRNAERPMGISELAAQLDLPLTTAHRVVQTLVALGYAWQAPSRKYVLGPRIFWLGMGADAFFEEAVRPHLSRIADALGEDVNLAVLDGTEIVYVAQAAGRCRHRRFAELGHRVDAHCTAAGKAIYATMPKTEVMSALDRHEFQRYTKHTITRPEPFMQELGSVHRRGFATDIGEHEPDTLCLAVALPHVRPHSAISISGPGRRITVEAARRAIPLLIEAARALDDTCSRGSRELWAGTDSPEGIFART